MDDVVPGDDPDEHPLTVSGAFTGDPGTAAAARRLTRDFLETAERSGEAPPPDLAAAVELVVSELVTNALRHAPGPCLLDLARLRGRVRVRVWDTSPSLPVTQSVDPARPGGHGLEIVRAMSTRVEVTLAAGGKCVTAWVTGPPPGRDG